MVYVAMTFTVSRIRLKQLNWKVECFQASVREESKMNVRKKKMYA
jgi:hypothetical protein